MDLPGIDAPCLIAATAVWSGGSDRGEVDPQAHYDDSRDRGGRGAFAFSSNALAFHVGCGETITADTSLDTDLACTGAAPAIEVGAHAVTFDLNGHTINHGGSAAPTTAT